LKNEKNNLENQNILCHGYSFVCLDKRKADGEIITKHDQKVSERKNARNVEQVIHMAFELHTNVHLPQLRYIQLN